MSSIYIFVPVILTFGLSFGAYLTHTYKCIVDGSYVLLLAGCIVFPVGVIHGWGIWFLGWK